MADFLFSKKLNKFSLKPANIKKKKNNIKLV